MITNKEIQHIIGQLEQLNSHNAKPIFTDSRNKNVQNLVAAINKTIAIQKSQNIELKDGEDKKRRLITNISHDLKTPLTVVNGLLEQVHLEQKSLEQNNSFIKKSREKLKETEKIINDFFELTKLEDKDYHIQLEKIALDELIRQVNLQFYDIINEEKLHFEIDIPDHPVFIMGNLSALTRVFNNLIHNAIKYGADGNIIGIALKEQNNKVYVTIWDRGKGIDEKYYNDVFERMFTLEDSRNKNYSGSGLGLSITKRLIYLQGGEITLKSIPDQYTEFKVTLNKV